MCIDVCVYVRVYMYVCLLVCMSVFSVCVYMNAYFGIARKCSVKMNMLLLSKLYNLMIKCPLD